MQNPEHLEALDLNRQALEILIDAAAEGEDLAAEFAAEMYLEARRLSRKIREGE